MPTVGSELPPRPPHTQGEYVLIFSTVCCVPALLLFILREPLGIEPSPILDAAILAPFIEALIGIGLIEIEKMQGKFPQN